MKKIISSLFILMFLLFSINLEARCDTEDSYETKFYKGEVIEIIKEDIKKLEETMPSGIQTLRIKLFSGPLKGKTFTMENITSGNPSYDCWFHKGDRLVLNFQESGDKIVGIDIEGYVRDNYIVYICTLFVFLLVAIGRKSGLKSVLTLGITVLMIAKVMLPLIFQGKDPVNVALITGFIITFITLLFIGGLSKKTVAAFLGTSLGLVVSAKIAILFGNLANLRGISEEEAQILMSVPGVQYNFQGLLFASIIIGALGAVMDVSMSIASSMEEISSVGGNLSVRNLIRSGMNVGRDIMGTMSNTLILAYAGASMNLLLVFMAYEPPFVKLSNMDFIATEFIRSLSGSIGLILTIPITAIIAGIILKLK